MKKKIIKFLLIAGLIWIVLPERTISRPPGVLLVQPPKRSEVQVVAPIPFKDYQLTLLQGYETTVRILAKKNYLPLDSGVGLAPIDMVFGWGVMSDSDVLDHMSFSIMNRYYRAHYDKGSQLVWDDMAPYVDNNHLIPATNEIKKALKSARVGNLIHLKGYLVEATKPDGYRWTSSMADGSVGQTVMTCKLIYVAQFDVLE